MGKCLIPRYDRYVDSAMDPATDPAVGGAAGASVAAPAAAPAAATRGSNPVRAFCERFFEEQSPTVPAVPGVDTAAYKVDLARRFSNPYIKDTLQRLAEDGSQKLVTTMRDAANENSAAGRPTPFFAFVVATWMRYLVGVDEQGAPIEIRDPRAAELTAMAREVFGAPGGTLPVRPPVEPPVAFLRAVFGDTLAEDAAIAAAVLSALQALATSNTRDVMAKLVED